VRRHLADCVGGSGRGAARIIGIQCVVGGVCVRVTLLVAYTVLIILTDGVVNDEQQVGIMCRGLHAVTVSLCHQVIDTIVNASGLPLSIIIIGIGGADFTCVVWRVTVYR
jgi:hypothetical protein